MSKKSDALFEKLESKFNSDSWSLLHKSNNLVISKKDKTLVVPMFYGLTDNIRLTISNDTNKYDIDRPSYGRIKQIANNIETFGYNAPQYTKNTLLIELIPSKIKLNAVEAARTHLSESYDWFNRGVERSKEIVQQASAGVQRYWGKIHPFEAIYSSKHNIYSEIKKLYPTKKEQKQLEVNNHLLYLISHYRMTGSIQRGTSSITSIHYSTIDNKEYYRIVELDNLMRTRISYMIFDNEEKNYKEKLVLIRQNNTQEKTTLSRTFTKENVYDELFRHIRQQSYLYKFLAEVSSDEYKETAKRLESIADWRIKYISLDKERKEKEKINKINNRKKTFQELTSEFDPVSNEDHLLIPLNVLGDMHSKKFQNNININRMSYNDDEDIESSIKGLAIIKINDKQTLEFYVDHDDKISKRSIEMIVRSYDYNKFKTISKFYSSSTGEPSRTYDNSEAWPNNIGDITTSYSKHDIMIDIVNLLPLLVKYDNLKNTSKYLVRDAKDILLKDEFKQDKLTNIEKAKRMIEMAHVIEKSNISTELESYLESYIRQVPNRTPYEYHNSLPTYMDNASLSSLYNLEEMLINIITRTIEQFNKLKKETATVKDIEKILTYIIYTKGLNEPIKLKNNLLKTFHLYSNIHTFLYEPYTKSLKLPTTIDMNYNLIDEFIESTHNENEEVDIHDLAILSEISTQSFDEDSPFHKMYDADRLTHEGIERRSDWKEFFNLLKYQYKIKGYIRPQPIYDHLTYLRDQEAFYVASWGGSIQYHLTHAMQEWGDYLNMATQIGKDMSDNSRFYVKQLATQHKIVQSLYNVTQSKRQQEKFKKVSNKYEKYNAEYEDYIIKVAEESSDLTDEGNQLGHCVSSYVDRMTNENSIIFFLRKSEDPERSLVTIEISKDGNKEKPFTVRQQRGKSNRHVTDEERTIILEWYEDKLIPSEK